MNARRDFLQSITEVSQLKGLEIGALDSPLVTAQELADRGKIFYLDHLSTEDLCSKYEDDDSVNKGKIVSVDFICPDGDIVKATKKEKFDYVVASHVVEHAPDLLKFLKEINDILNPGGVFFLVVPDKRFTFDLNRPETTFGSVLRAFLARDTKPGVDVVYDHFSMATKVNGHNRWHGIGNKEDQSLLLSEAKAWDLAQDVNNKDEYFDVHVNVFTPRSFFEILKKVISHGIVSFEVQKFTDTQIGQIEFLVGLRKPLVGLTENQKKKQCLETIPDLPLESILSPYMPQIKSLSSALGAMATTNQNLQDAIEVLRTKFDDNEQALVELEGRLRVAQRTLDRKSVRFILAAVEKIYSTFRGRKS